MKPGHITADIHPGRHLVRSLRLYRSHPFTLLEISAFGVIPTMGSYLVPTTWTGWVVFQIPFFVALQVVYAALVYAAASFASERDVPTTDTVGAYRMALRELPDIVEVLARQFGAAILLAITIVGIPWAVRLFVRWHFAIYAVLLNDQNAKGGISFSCQLVTGRWWQIAGLLLATSAPGIVLSLWVLPLTQSTLSSTAFWVIYSLVSTPLIATFWTLQFLELRGIRPGYQMESMSAT